MVSAWVLAVAAGAIGLVLFGWVVMLLVPVIRNLVRRTDAD